MLESPTKPAAASRRRSVTPRIDHEDVRLAAIDVGSNSLHMIIVRLDSSGAMSLLARSREMVGLGRMSFPSKKLSLQAMERAKITLRRFVGEARRWQCDAIVAVATSAVREAENGGAFIEQVRRELKIHVRVVSAREEARLIYLGVKQAIDLSGGPHLILDIGGGSVEFIVASGEKALLLESRKLGAARMTAKFVKSDPVDAKELAALVQHYEEQLDPLTRDIARHKPINFIASSGAVENLATMCAEIAKDPPNVVRATTLEKLVSTLIDSTSDDRAKLAGLDDKRRDQILAAALLLREVCRKVGAEQFQLSRSALREGILADYLAKHRPQIDTRQHVADPRRRSVMDLGIRCLWHQEHAVHVAMLCTRLFDQLRSLHRLKKQDRELIEYAALLHDIGSLIARKKHHKHSMYLIMNGGLEHFTKTELCVIANIARYHRKSPPRLSDPEFEKLPRELRQTVRVGTALLRIADGLDRTNYGVVRDVSCQTRPDRVEIRIESRGDAELELWSASTRALYFSEVFGRSAAIRQA